MQQASKQLAGILLSLSILAVGIMISFGVITYAQSALDSIEYPIAELGGCGSQEECQAYCEEISHIEECLAFAEEHNLLTPDELEEARHFAAAGFDSGPGDCSTQDECESYCEDVTHLDECLVFGEEHNLLTPDELEEARRVQRALAEGAELPGGCQSKDVCELYCEDTAHLDECLAFAEVAGFLSPDELEGARRFSELLAQGETPGGCRGKFECKAYCEDGEHFDECVAFALEAGFLPPGEAEMIRKTGGRGPGGCRGREECDSFCNESENQEICFAFAKEYDLISDEELSHLEENISHFRQGLAEAPPEVRACLDEHLPSDIITRLNSGDFLPTPDLGERMRACFDEFARKDFVLQIRSVLADAPPEVRACVEGELGGNILDRINNTDSLRFLDDEFGQVMDECFKRAFGEFDSDKDFQERGGHFEGEFERGFEGSGIPGSDLPPEIESCLVKRLGTDLRKRLASGEISPTDVQAEVGSCSRALEELRHQEPLEQESFEEIQHEGDTFLDTSYDQGAYYAEGGYSSDGGEGTKIEESSDRQLHKLQSRGGFQELLANVLLLFGF